jgi:type VI secretion system protein ImpM
MTLEQDCGFEDVKHALETLPLPAVAKPSSSTWGALQLPQGASLARVFSASFVNAFADARAAGHVLTYAATTCWWTAGGESYEPRALTALRMPDPYLYAGMLTGHFENEATLGSSR